MMRNFFRENMLQLQEFTSETNLVTVNESMALSCLYEGINNHVVIIGAGFSGLAIAIRLKKAGIDDFTILEQSHEVGGTWRDNHYPGAACDIPSPVYSYSFEPNANWSKMFSPQQEILEYLKKCADKYKLRPHIRFLSTVESSQFNEQSGLWTVNIKDQSPLQARFFVLCSGGLSRPSYPEIQGLQDFEGALFHSARWNHDFPLENSRVAVIGTGASSIQIVPAIADKVGQLSVFQRTAAWILPKAERNFGNREKKLLARIPLYRWLMRKFLYWQYEIRALGLLKPVLMPLAQKIALKYLYREVKDRKLREKLTPSYTMGCKRILLSNEFYKAMSRSNTQLITKAIDRVTPHGILTNDGIEHKFDALICATGFQVAEASAPFSIKGLQGQELSQAWQNGAEAYLGTSVAGFPNFFIIVGPNSGLGHNSIVFIIESQAQYILDAIKKITVRKLKYVDVKTAVQQSFNAELARRFKNTVWTTGNCVSWYQTKSGKNTTIWPGFSFQFRQRTRAFRISDYVLHELTDAAADSVVEEKRLSDRASMHAV
ncbi:MAG: flavin-containing monooxygenase [Oligoflexus sp.]